MSERETWMSEEAAFDWIEDRLRKNGGIAPTVANASLYLDCGRAADAYSDIAELVEPIVRSAVEKAVAMERERLREIGGTVTECPTVEEIAAATAKVLADDTLHKVFNWTAAARSQVMVEKAVAEKERECEAWLPSRLELLKLCKRFSLPPDAQLSALYLAEEWARAAVAKALAAFVRVGERRVLEARIEELESYYDSDADDAIGMRVDAIKAKLAALDREKKP